MTIPYLLGVFLVFLFNQAPEFVLIGIFIGGTIVQAMFFTTVLETTLLKGVVFGTILFIGLLGVTLLAKSIDGINSLTYEMFPLDTNSNKVLRVIALYAFLCMMIWELIHYFINSVMMKKHNLTEPRHTYAKRKNCN